MSKIIKKYKLTVVASLLSLSVFSVNNSYAGGGRFGGATEITQILNNAELVAMLGVEERQMAELLYQSYVLGEELYLEYQHIKSLDFKFGREQALELLTQLERLTRAQEETERMHGNLSELNAALLARQVEAANEGLTTEQYVEKQAKLIQNNNQAAKQRISREQQLIKDLQRDHAKISEWANEIPKTEGMQQSLSLLNVQMNKSLQQLSRLAELTAQGNDELGKAEELAKANEEMIRTRRVMSKHEENSRKTAEELKRLGVLVTP